MLCTCFRSHLVTKFSGIPHWFSSRICKSYIQKCTILKSLGLRKSLDWPSCHYASVFFPFLLHNRLRQKTKTSSTALVVILYQAELWIKNMILINLVFLHYTTILLEQKMLLYLLTQFWKKKNLERKIIIEGVCPQPTALAQVKPVVSSLWALVLGMGLFSVRPDLDLILASFGLGWIWIWAWLYWVHLDLRLSLAGPMAWTGLCWDGYGSLWDFITLLHLVASLFSFFRIYSHGFLITVAGVGYLQYSNCVSNLLCNVYNTNNTCKCYNF